ncbi:MAG TPA: diguanylate cyclase, partial [Solirubrobacteraceae bacterium]
LAIAVLLAFLVLAFVFALAVSRALQSQVQRFLAADKRLGAGDFSTPVPIEGNDEFAELGREFNNMADQLDTRIGELRQERARLQESIRRIGESFAANLDRGALLELGCRTAVDAVEAAAGRVSVRNGTGELVEGARAGDLDGFEEAIHAAESAALTTRRTAEGVHGDVHALAAPLGQPEEGPRLAGLLSVARAGRAFTPTEQEVLSSLAGQAGVSIENVDLHEQVRRQAVTDELTGLSNHRRFQEALAGELDRARRFEQDVGLLMLDIDNFKRVNDTYGHPQGDEVLRQVARVLRECSRDVDEPARYGGEEMAVILPQTDLEGAYQAAERVREAIAALAVRHLEGGEPLRLTASLGVAATTRATRQELISAADKALYEAKHSGKNRTVRGAVEPVDVVSGG